MPDSQVIAPSTTDSEFGRAPVYGLPTGPVWMALHFGFPSIAHVEPRTVIAPPDPPIT